MVHIVRGFLWGLGFMLAVGVAYGANDYVQRYGRCRAVLPATADCWQFAWFGLPREP